MPMGLVRAYTDAMERVDAREKLGDLHVQQLGSGMMKKQDQSRAVRDLQTRAGVRRKPRKMSPGDLQAMGIATIEEPKNG